MKVMIEPLESRTLFSMAPVITADIASITATTKALASDVVAGIKTARTDAATITADLRRLQTLKPDKALLALLQKQETGASVTFKKDMQLLIAAGKKDMNRVVVDFKQLSSHPGNAIIGAKFTVDLGILAIAVAGPAETLAGDLTAGVTIANADLATIGDANPADPKTQVDVAAAQNDISSDSVEIQNAASAVGKAITQLVTDLTT